MARSHHARLLRYPEHSVWFARRVKHNVKIPAPKERVEPVEDQVHQFHLESLGVERDADLSNKAKFRVDPFDDTSAFEDHSDCAQCNGWDELGDYVSWDDDYENVVHPSSPAWAELWVDGAVCDDQGRDEDHDLWYLYDLDDLYDYDALAELENPLLEREEPTPPIVDLGRAREKHRAGERYYRAHRRTA
jgi:hypothetical protein